MKERFYNRFEDFLWGTLGAFFGNSLKDVFGWSAHGFFVELPTTLAGSALLLLLTGLVRGDERWRRTWIDVSGKTAERGASYL